MGKFDHLDGSSAFHWRPLAKKTTRDLISKDVIPSVYGYISHELVEGSLVIDVGWQFVKIAGQDGETVSKLLNAIDGLKGLPALAAELDWSVGKVHLVLQDLFLQGIIEDKSKQVIKGITFHDNIVSVGRALRKSMLKRVSILGDGEVPSKRVLLGSLVEAYHYVQSAASHIAPAVAGAPNERMSLAFGAFLEDEYMHGEWLKSGLLQSGCFTEEEFTEAYPLAETLGQINHLRWLSRNNVYAYSVILGVVEAPPAGQVFIDKAIADWNKIKEYNLLDEAVYAPFRDHEIHDIGVGHASLSAEVFVECGYLSREQQRNIENALFALIDIQEKAYLAVKEFYSGDGPYFYSLKPKF